MHLVMAFEFHIKHVRGWQGGRTLWEVGTYLFSCRWRDGFPVQQVKQLSQGRGCDRTSSPKKERRNMYISLCRCMHLWLFKIKARDFVGLNNQIHTQE